MAEVKKGLELDSEGFEIVTTVKEYFLEAETAKKSRMDQNDLNWQVYRMEQDWRHKQPGQSTEALPKVTTAVEQVSSAVKRALIDPGDWFSVEEPSDEIVAALFPSDVIFNLLKHVLDQAEFSVIASDALKSGLLGSLIIGKVYGRFVDFPVFFTEPAEEFVSVEGGGVETRRRTSLMKKSKKMWRLQIDLIRPEDWFPDPTGNGLYEIHRINRDFHDVLELAEQGVYDLAAVKAIETGFTDEIEKWKKERQAGQDTTASAKPKVRRNVEILECWGTILDEDGKVKHKNVVCAVANKKFLIRKPEKNPFWHGLSPFVSAPLARVPHSVWHRAFMDSGTNLNLTINEMVNMILDGGMSAVHGIKQIKTHFMEDPAEASGGIPYGKTLRANESLPPGEHVMDRVDTGGVPQDAFAVLGLLNKEFEAATMTPDIRLGRISGDDSTATEVLQASQAIQGIFEGVAKDFEDSWIEKILEKSWKTSLQHIDDFAEPELVNAIGQAKAMLLQKLSKEERFALLAFEGRFKVHGISFLLNSIKEFQKLVSLLEVVSRSELLSKAFFEKFSINKFLTQLVKTAGINADKIKPSDQELAQQQRQLAQTQTPPGSPGSVPNRTENAPFGPPPSAEPGGSVGESSLAGTLVGGGRA